MCNVLVMGDFRTSGPRAYLALLALAGAAVATGLGKCPVYPALPNFQIERMSGIWYEVERSFYLMELAASCTTLNVTLNEKGYLLITVDTVSRWTGSPSTTYGLGIPTYSGAPAFRYRTQNRLPYVLGRLLPGAGHYSVLGTDYDHYAVVWACDSVSIAHADRFWVLGRTREFGAVLRAQIYAALQALHLDPDRLIVSRNNNCSDSETTTVVSVADNNTI